MELSEAFNAFEAYDLWLVIIGLAVLATSVLPRLLSKHPFSMPIALLALGYAAVALPLGLEAPDPLAHGDIAEHLTELGVITALMGAGLKIDRKFSVKGWAVTWRLLGVTMVLTIALAALLGWWVAALAPATAVLLGAVIAPTDPVLAADVQVGSPSVSEESDRGEKDREGDEDDEDEEDDEDDEDELRFALTSEAGLNDGLAFPFTNLAIAMALAGPHPANWFEAWALVDVLYKLLVALFAGLGLGYLFALVIMALPSETHLAKSMVGLGALAATLLLFGLTEYIGGYGFLATFIGAVVIRQHEHRHEYHSQLHKLSEKLERLLTAVILIAFGGAIAGGLLAPLDWSLVACALLFVFVVRPVAGVLGLLGFERAVWAERLAIGFYGIRGAGSLYYLSYALNSESFAGAQKLWALVGLVIVISIIVHGVTASPVTDVLDKLRQRKQAAAGAHG